MLERQGNTATFPRFTGAQHITKAGYTGSYTYTWVFFESASEGTVSTDVDNLRVCLLELSTQFKNKTKITRLKKNQHLQDT